MLQPATIKFIRDLAKNNNKPWFDAHKDEYAAAKEDFEALTAGILQALGATQLAFREQKAKDCIFRIFRDVRFSKDKTPYKDHFGAFFSVGGRKFPGAGYYLHVQPGGKSFAGGGMWMPEQPLLKSVRQEIDYNFDEFKSIINKKSFKKLFPKIDGEQLKTLPQGYTADNPAIDYLKMKGFTVGTPLSDEDFAAKTFTKNCVNIFNEMQPFIEFLNRPLN